MIEPMSQFGLLFPDFARTASGIALGSDWVSLTGAQFWELLETATRSFKSQDFAQQAKIVGLVSALLALSPNLRALLRVRTLMVNCEVPMNLTGKRLGPRAPYVGPIRRTMFIFALFVFYQLVSQISGMLTVTTVERVLMELFFQLGILIWLLLSFREIDQVVIANFEGDETRIGRMRQELDGALSSSGIKLNRIFWTGAMMPLFSVLPKSLEASGQVGFEELQKVLQALQGA